MENYQIQWLLFVRTILSSITAGSVGESPKKSIEKGQAYMFYEMISGFIYAMPCIVFVCVYWAFSAMRFASLYKRERALSWEWKERASDRKDSPSRVRENY